MDKYVIEDNFKTDPEEKGWYEEPDLGKFSWVEAEEKLRGRIEEDNRYVRYLSELYNETNLLEFKIIFECEVDWLSPDPKAVGFLGFSRKDKPLNESFVGVELKDGMKIKINDELSSQSLSLQVEKKYVIFFRYVPEDGKAYLSSYDYITEQPMDEILMNIPLGTNFKVNQTGIYSESGEYWWLDIFDFKSIRIYETIYTGLYCTPEEARKLTNLDAAQDMSDNMFAQLIRIYSMPQVNSRFRAEGYRTPFSTDEDTPPLIRTLTALLTAAYAGKKSYTGHSQNVSPVYKELLKEVNDLFEGLSYGDYELLDVDGSIINRSLHTSTDMRSTTEGRTGIFSLDDVPDITEIMNGGKIIDGK